MDKDTIFGFVVPIYHFGESVRLGFLLIRIQVKEHLQTDFSTLNIITVMAI